MFDTLTSVETALAELAAGFEPGTLSGEQAQRALDRLGRLRRLVDGLFAKTAKRVEDTGVWVRGNARDAAAAIADAAGITSGEARSLVATAEKLETLPAVDAAVRDGTLSARQAEMIANAATLNPAAEQDLLDAAAQGLTPLKDACIEARARVEDPAARAKRQHKARSLRMWTADDGMVEGRFKLTPEIGGQLKAVIDDGVQRIFRARRSGDEHEPHEAYAADVLAGLLRGDRAVSGVQATVHVLVDHAAVTRGDALPGETCEIPGVGPVNVEWVRGLLGDAFVTAVIRRGKDVTTVAHLGRRIPAEVRTALFVGGRECDVEGCHCRGYLEIDHDIPYAEGGLTSLENLGWLCYLHHKRKTAGWILGPRDPTTGKRTLAPPASRRTDAP